MRRFLSFLATALIAMALLSCGGRKSCSEAEQAAYDVISRVLGHSPRNLEIRITGTEPEFYATEVSGGRLTVTASSVSAACRGVYDYAGRNGYGMFTWTVKNIRMPRHPADSPEYRVETPFKYRQYLNVCTYGYTMPYWDWERWEKELDWMAMHGINMVLSPIGSEAIFARVWRKLGLTDEEIGEFESGPAHLPWFRMGNMTELDGPLSDSYYEKTIALEHKLIDRMKQLGIKPIYNAFAGFVPSALVRVCPEARLIHTGWDDGPKYVSNFISPDTEIFQRISKMYIEEWEAEFGKGEFYLADSFNEMKVPFAPHGSAERFGQIATYGKYLYDSIVKANPEATWVLQGWMFGYQRDIWDPESIRALFSEVPDDKVLLLDLSTDFNNDIWESEFTWNYAPKLYGKKWIYSTVPNFGGRSAPIGNLEYYLNGHVNALESPNRGAMVGIGSAPEGVENNEVIYEIIYSAPWNESRRDIHEYLEQYSKARYGDCPDEMKAFWDGMLETSYGFCSSQGVYRLQRQPFFQRGGRYDVSDRHFKAIESFVEASGVLGRNREYLTDLAMYAGFYAFGKADILAEEIHRLYKTGDVDGAEKLRPRFRELMMLADGFFDANPIMRLDRWVGFASAWADTPQEARAYATNAKRLITIWGPGKIHDGLDDYAARMWSGLVRDYYLPRWEHAFDAWKNGTDFDFDAWEYKFAEGELETTPSVRIDDLVGAARRMVSGTSDISLRTDEYPGWMPCEVKKGLNRYRIMIYPEDYLKLKGLRFKHVSGDATVTVRKVRIRGAKEDRYVLDGLNVKVGPASPSAEVRLGNEDTVGRKYLYLDVFFDAPSDKASSNVLIEKMY